MNGLPASDLGHTELGLVKEINKVLVWVKNMLHWNNHWQSFSTKNIYEFKQQALFSCVEFVPLVNCLEISIVVHITEWLPRYKPLTFFNGNIITGLAVVRVVKTSDLSYLRNAVLKEVINSERKDGLQVNHFLF